MITMFRLLFIVLFLGSLTFFYWDKTKEIIKKDRIMIIILGIFGVFINQWSFYVGLETADLTIVACFLIVIFLKEQISIQMIFSSLIAIIGIFYIVTKGHFTNIHIDRGIM